MKPLNEKLRLNNFNWGNDEQKAFQEVKDSYQGDKILNLHDPEKTDWVTRRCV
jgi:hypothetical protein